MSSRWVAREWRSDGPYNWMSYSDPETDRLIDAAGTDMNASRRAATIAQAPSGRAAAGLHVSNVGSGYNHQVIFSGINKAYVGAAVTSVGWPAAVANSGWLTNATSGAVVVGRFLATASSGDLDEVGI